MNRIRWYGPTLVLLATVLLVMVAGPQLARQIAWAQTDAQINNGRKQLREKSQFLGELSKSFREVAKVVEPSVVSIEVLSKQDERQNPRDMLRRWFGPNAPGQRPDAEEDNGSNEFEEYDPAQPFGNGSGWVYHHDAANGGEKYIITNNHVIRQADEIRVRFSDGAKYQATVVGTDPRTDVAVLKVNAPDLHAAAIAPNGVEQGDIVFALGSPFRFDFSISQGIVSAKGRQLGIIGPGGYENFIQTDAAINPGNSGGPLTNIYGEVIGMNTAIASRTGVYNGLGFAIPVQMAIDVADQLIEKGRVERGYLGVYIEDLTERAAQTFDFDGDGVLVVDPIPDSPADDAGLQAGDIITQVNGNAVASADELRNMIAGFQPGTDVELTVVRNGEQVDPTPTVTLGELPSRDRMSQRSTPNRPGESPQPDSEGVETLRKLGIEAVQTFSEQMAQRLGATPTEGVLIRQVRSGSAADAAGVTRGMIITRVMSTEVSNGKELVEAVEGHAPGKPLRLRVAEWNPEAERYNNRFVFLELPDSE